MDAHKEAEKRYARMGQNFGGMELSGSALAEREAFVAGAAWALREFGEALGSGSRHADNMFIKLALADYETKAHHIADGIEES